MSKTREQELEDALRLAISGLNDIPNTRLQYPIRGLAHTYAVVAYLEMIEREGRELVVPVRMMSYLSGVW